MKLTLDLAVSLGIVTAAALFAAYRFARTLRRGKPSCCSDPGEQSACEDGQPHGSLASGCADCALKERCGS